MKAVYTFLYFITLCAASCKQAKKRNIEGSATPKNGKIYISVDESFKPVIEEQIKVYESSNPGAHIIAKYKPEAECLKDLAYDSIRMVIATRGLTKDEEIFYTDKLQYTPEYGLLALDAVVVIASENASNSHFSVNQLAKFVTGKDSSFKVILDGLSATSTVRYVLDSLVKNNELSKNVQAAKNTQELMSYVAVHNNVIGLLGLSWIGDMTDASQQKIVSNIKVASILCTRCDSDAYIQPNPVNIRNHTYPMVRGLFYIIKENYTGLGTGFVNFMSLERGQLIFRRAYLVPAKMSFDVRKVQIN